MYINIRLNVYYIFNRISRFFSLDKTKILLKRLVNCNVDVEFHITRYVIVPEQTIFRLKIVFSEGRKL